MMGAGQNIYISGIRRGIGRALAMRRATAGDRIAGFAAHADGLDDLAAELAEAGATATHLAAADLRVPGAVEGWARAASEEVGPPEVIVHCAAVLGPRAPLLEVGDEAFVDVLEVNVAGTLRLLRATAALADTERPALWIWATSSVGARGRAGWGPYAASKAALENLSETWADETRDRPWTSVAINPGGTRTDMRSAAYPDEDPTRLPTADAVAGAFERLVDDWRAGTLASGSRHDARELVPELAG